MLVKWGSVHLQTRPGPRLLPPLRRQHPQSSHLSPLCSLSSAEQVQLLNMGLRQGAMLPVEWAFIDMSTHAFCVTWDALQEVAWQR